jgi:hypothetical protein
MVPEIAYMLGLIDSQTWMTAFAATLDQKRLQRLREEIVSRGEYLTPAP